MTLVSDILDGASKRNIEAQSVGGHVQTCRSTGALARLVYKAGPC